MKIEKQKYYGSTVYFITLSGIRYKHLITIDVSKNSLSIEFIKELKNAIR